MKDGDTASCGSADGVRFGARGGKREGAGRKWEGRVQFTLTVAPETKAALRREASRRGTTVGRMIDGITKDMLNNKNDTI